jgi:hypothetical protein
MAGIFDFLLKNPGVEARDRRLAAERDLAERKFSAQQEAERAKASSQQADRLIEFLDRSDLSPQARDAIGKKLSSLPQFRGLRAQPQLPQKPGAEEFPSLFDFTQPKRQIKGEFRPDTVTSTDPITGETKVLQQPQSARDQAFARLTPQEQETVVQKGPGSTVNVSVDTGKEDVTKNSKK